LRNRIHVFLCGNIGLPKNAFLPAQGNFRSAIQNGGNDNAKVLFRCVDIPARFSRIRIPPLISRAVSAFHL